MKPSLFFLILVILFTPLMLPAQEFTFGMGISDTEPLFMKVQELWNAVAEEMGDDVKITLKYIPYERSRSSTIKGVIDGDSGRAPVVYKGESDVVIVDVPVLTIPYFIFSKGEVTDMSPAALKKKRFIVEQGSVITTNYLKENNYNYIEVHGASNCLNMILKKRADYYVAGSVYAELLKQLEFAESGLVMGKTPLFYQGSYLFLNKKHRNLVPRFEAALKTLIENGTVKRIFSM